MNLFLQVFRNGKRFGKVRGWDYGSSLGTRSKDKFKGKFKGECNAGGAGENHIGPQKFFPRPSRTLPTPFPFPLNSPPREEVDKCPQCFSSSAGRLGEAERGWWGCGGGGRKTLGPYGFSPASPALHLYLYSHFNERRIVSKFEKVSAGQSS